MSTAQESRMILLVEDDPLILSVAEEILREAGYRVVSAHDGEAALERLLQIKPDLIVSDVRMPRCDGFELLQRVRRDPEHLATPFIIMSAKAETSAQRMGMSLGADDYLTKPYLPADLLKTIEVRLARAALVGDRLRLQQQFLTRVLPHELRTPLAGIIGFADLLVQIGESGDTLKPSDLVDYGHSIGRSGQRLLDIAKDFSLWSWLEATKTGGPRDGGAKLRQSRITLESLRRWSENCVLRYGRTDDLSIEDQTAMVVVPEDGLERVFEHLVENALKFSLPGTPVRVKIVVSPSACEIRVTDGGRGMSQADLEQVGAMRQFGRETFEQQGLGMGLWLAMKFARIGGGDFTIGRNEPGPGMTACLRLVRAEG